MPICYEEKFGIDAPLGKGAIISKALCDFWVAERCSTIELRDRLQFFFGRLQ